MRASDRGHLVADHRGMAVRCALMGGQAARVVVARVVVPPGGGIAVESELADQRHGRQRRGGREELTPRETCFSHD